MENTVITYDYEDINDTSLILAPAPFIADKVDEHKERIWNEFLRLIGIANMNFQKKERNIKDEIIASQGGTVASRYNRFEPRKKALEEIYEKFKDITLDNGELAVPKPLEVNYYDGLPSTKKEDNEEDIEDDTRL